MDKPIDLVAEVSRPTDLEIKKWRSSNLYISRYTEAELKSAYKILPYFSIRSEEDFEGFFFQAIKFKSLTNKVFQIPLLWFSKLNSIFDDFNDKIYDRSIECAAVHGDWLNIRDNIVAYCEEDACWKLYLITGYNLNLNNTRVNDSYDIINRYMRTGLLYVFTNSNNGVSLSRLCIYNTAGIKLYESDPFFTTNNEKQRRRIIQAGIDRINYSC